MIRAIFVDRDGTINLDKGHVGHRENFEYIDGAPNALRRASERGIEIYVVTNQAGIAKGLYTEEDFMELTRFMIEDLARNGCKIAEVLYCPHHPDGTVEKYRILCECRKPGTELLRRVIDGGGYRPSELAMIGDKNSDVEAGRRIGMKTYLVQTGYGSVEKSNTEADFVVADLAAAIDQILMDNSLVRDPPVNEPLPDGG